MKIAINAVIERKLDKDPKADEVGKVEAAVRDLLESYNFGELNSVSASEIVPNGRESDKGSGKFIPFTLCLLAGSKKSGTTYMANRLVDDFPRSFCRVGGVTTNPGAAEDDDKLTLVTDRTFENLKGSLLFETEDQEGRTALLPLFASHRTNIARVEGSGFATALARPVVRESACFLSKIGISVGSWDEKRQAGEGYEADNSLNFCDEVLPNGPWNRLKTTELAEAIVRNTRLSAAYVEACRGSRALVEAVAADDGFEVDEGFKGLSEGEAHGLLRMLFDGRKTEDELRKQWLSVFGFGPESPKEVRYYRVVPRKFGPTLSDLFGYETLSLLPFVPLDCSRGDWMIVATTAQKLHTGRKERRKNGRRK